MALGTTLGYTFSNFRKKPNLENSNVYNSTTMKSSSSPISLVNTMDTKPIMPFSADVVIYNSHSSEDYLCGTKITEVGALINAKLMKEGLNSSFIKCTPVEDVKAYQSTRKLITQNVKAYANTILLDIHRDVTTVANSNTKQIIFTLAKKNPHYEENIKFVNKLLENVEKENGIKAKIFYYNTGVDYFNQDLSNNSVLIEIGNNMSSNSDIEACTSALASDIKNTYKASSN